MAGLSASTRKVFVASACSSSLLTLKVSKRWKYGITHFCVMYNAKVNFNLSHTRYIYAANVHPNIIKQPDLVRLFNYFIVFLQLLNEVLSIVLESVDKLCEIHVVLLLCWSTFGWLSHFQELMCCLCGRQSCFVYILWKTGSRLHQKRI